MENKQIIIIGAIILIAVAIICGTVVFLNINESNKTPVNNQTNTTPKNVTADRVNTEQVQQQPKEPERAVYAYRSDGSPLYSYQEAQNYITQKYGPGMTWHVQDNKYISLDTPGYTSDGRKLR